MTESEWLECTDPHKMLSRVWRKASRRKRRLFGCACCRRIWRLIDDTFCLTAIEIAERFADRKASATELRAVNNGVNDPARVLTPGSRISVPGGDGPAARAAAAAYCATASYPNASRDAAVHAEQGAAYEVVKREGFPFTNSPAEEDIQQEEIERARRIAQTEYQPQCGLVRDLFGNPFCPVSINPAWLTPTVTNLAAVAYEERILPSGELDRDRLAVLADSFEDAGCTDAAILEHLRGPGPHVRGCWALDLILGKS